MPTTNFDTLIIGQGLAGSILAHQLITRGLRVMVIDNHHNGSSSNVAAGIINPITGPRLSCSDSFNPFYQYAKPYYAKLAYHIKTNVFHHIKQSRQIQNSTEIDYLEKRLADEKYPPYLSQDKHHQNSPFTDTSKPLLQINHTAIVDTKKLLNATKQWLMSLHSYQETKFDYTDLQFNVGSTDYPIAYHGISAKHIIFCEGYQAINNPWLQQLPFKLAKGEILTLDNPDSIKQMLSWGKWLVPHANTLKLGSNFVWDNVELTLNPQVKQELLDSLQQRINIETHLINHEVGIRPSTDKREPFIGPISTLQNAYCFNGFGSKGCLLIPHYASLLSEHLINQTPLPPNVTQCL